MNRRDHMDPDFARGLEDVLSARVARDRRRRADGVLAAPWQAVIAIAVAAIVIGASAAALLVALPRSAPAGRSDPLPSITVHGRPLVYVGPITWSDAQWTDAAKTRAALVADPYSLHRSRVPSCGAVAGRARVTASGSVVVDAYGFALPPDAGCGMTAAQPIHVAVQLPGPLGGRALVDGTGGRAHVVLDPAIVPVPTALPTAFQPRGTMWDERIATRIWATDTPKKGSYVDYVVDYNTSTEAPIGGAYGKLAGRIEVHGHPAVVFVNQGSYEWTAYVEWSVGGGRTMQLASHGNVRNHRPIAEIERVAESTPDP